MKYCMVITYQLADNTPNVLTLEPEPEVPVIPDAPVVPVVPDVPVVPVVLTLEIPKEPVVEKTLKKTKKIKKAVIDTIPEPIIEIPYEPVSPTLTLESIYPPSENEFD